jgi:hypothetical protein
MTTPARILTSVALGALGVLAAAGIYAEATHVRDQP